MKNILTVIAFVLALCATQAQSLKDQTQEINELQKGTYTAFLPKQDDSGKYTGGIADNNYFVIAITDYRVAPTSRHKEVYITSNAKYNINNLDKYPMYIPDNEAFPVTYISNSYEGNTKLQKSIGFTPRQEKYHQESRAVFLDGKIYVIKDWKSKDDYNLTHILEFQKEKLKGFKKLKFAMKSKKKMNEAQPIKKLQAYLDEGFAKQKQVYATWLKDPINKGLKQKKKDISTLMAKTIRKMSNDYLKSDEFKRIQENNRLAEQRDNASKVNIKNNTGKTIYVYEEGSRNGSTVRANSNGFGNCKKALYYTFSSNSSVNGGGTKFYTGNQSCGGSVNVN